MPHHQTPNTAIPTKTHTEPPKTHQAVTSQVSGLLTVAAGACLATALPRAARVTLIWLATLAAMHYLFIIGMAVNMSLMSCVMIGGIAAWLSIRILR